MKKFLLLVPVLFIMACSQTTQPNKTKTFDISQNKIRQSIPDWIEISHTQWAEQGKPLYDIELYKDQFFAQQLGRFEITESLVLNAEKELYQLSKEEYVCLFQQHTTPESMNRVYNKIMQREYLYTREGPFYVEVSDNGDETCVPKPKKNGYKVDFTTLYTANLSKHSHEISMIFHSNELYGKPKGLSASETARYAQKGAVLCCAIPVTLAAYEKNDSLEYYLSSELMEFPYFKRTEVNKHLQNDLVVKVDSTISILKFGIHRPLSVGDQQRFINGRLDSDFVNVALQFDLDY